MFLMPQQTLSIQAIKCFINSTYKTSTILNSSDPSFLFVLSDAETMLHGAIKSALTSTFKQAKVFGQAEYVRVCPTRIRCSCATFRCKSEGIDSGYFAKHFMKNKEYTTQIHYNLFSNHREALKLAMLVRNTFEIGDFKKVLERTEKEDLTNSIYIKEKRSYLQKNIYRSG